MKDTLHYIRTLCRFVLLGLLVGLVCGTVGTVFYHAIALATRLRTGHPWLLYLLPVAGLLTAYLYALLKMEKDPGTDAVLRTTKDAQTVPARLAALIFSGTFLTHLCGGSAGREGAALQIGGGLGTAISRLLKLSEGETKLVTMCGMSAVFSAVFGTPLTAAVFSIEVASVGMISSTAMLPCAISSLTAAYIARLLGAAGEAYALEGVPALNLQSLLPALLLGLICALVSILFCEVMHASRRLFGRWFPNRYVRVVVGAVLVVGASLLLGTGRYNGAGADVIAQAIEEGRALPYDGIVKLLLTAITLGCGMKGGEIVPAFFVGSTMGCLLGPLVGLSPSFGAALCMVGLFCGVVNCPIASILLSMELFGGAGLSLFVLVAAVSFACSGRHSLYSAQSFVFDKASV